MLWLQFFCSAALIVVAGVRLTVYADILSGRFRIGRMWIGLVLLGVVTSLPEAVASFTSALFLNVPDLAVGNLIGSNNFNLCLILVMDLVYRKGPVTNQVRFSGVNVYPALLSVLLTAVMVLDIGLGPRALRVGPFSAGTVLVLAGYFWGVRFLYRCQNKGGLLTPLPAERDFSALPAANIFATLFVSAAVVVVSAAWLSGTADRIADVTGLGRTFVGTFLLAMVTSLPEMVVTVSAVRLGALDMAVGNIFGSNMINMFLLAMCDVFYWRGALLAGAGSRHITAGVCSIILTLVALAGMKHSRKKALAGVGWDSWTIGSLFLLCLGVMYPGR